MSLASQRQIASRILKVGYNRVWIDPERSKEAETAITRKEVTKLISDGVIKARPDKGVSRSRAKTLHKKKRMGRRSNVGSREGKKYARLPKKKLWMMKIRSLRKKLAELKEKKAITNTTYRSLYALAKGGAFRNVSHLLQNIESKDLYRRKK
jgi:large subunit ribosomal protein L19e